MQGGGFTWQHTEKVEIVMYTLFFTILRMSNYYFKSFNIPSELEDMIHQMVLKQRVRDELLVEEDIGVPFNTLYSVNLIYNNFIRMDRDAVNDISGLMIQWLKFHKWITMFDGGAHVLEETKKLDYIWDLCHMHSQRCTLPLRSTYIPSDPARFRS
jgi:hypothetical protein